MASKSTKERHFLPRPEETGNASETGTEGTSLSGGRRKRRRRDANVYDAVAGRVSTTRPLDDGSGSEVASHHHHYRARTSRDHHHRDPTLAPEEVLFRRVGAPVRYAEKDIYQAHESLRDGGRGVLPDSDMLKAIHSYTSHFYAALASSARGPTRAEENDQASVRNVDERSMDETALLAFGILVEEAGREVLGRMGDLVFTEGAEVGQDGEQPGE
ncbi:hypothetical protein F5Y13DRAFT_184148 [Hypoxylon sp. FL1857]|nr:hypothetical protein F5Y13DRAFT_184148 [Hypoxylon sp. FL1857]